MSDYLDALKRTQHNPPDHRPAAPQTFTGNVTPYAAKALRNEAAEVAAAPEGTRNDRLNRAYYSLGQLAAAGQIDLATVRDTLADAARQCGLDDKEIATVLREDATSAAANANPRQIPPLEPLPHLTAIVAAPPDDVLDDFWSARPALAHIHQFARARRAGPWATLGNVLARVVTATHPALCLPPLVGSKASLNLFVGVVGSSGIGKGAAAGAAKDAISLDKHIEIRNPGSGEGIVHAFVKRQRDGTIIPLQEALLFDVPEIDTLAALSKRTGTTLMPLLRSAWSGEQIGFTNADQARNVFVEAHRYRLTLVAGIQPGRAGSLLDDSDGGTPQRFLWLPSTDPNLPETKPDEPQPLPISTSEPIFAHEPMAVPESVKATLDANRVRALKGDGEALDGHAGLTRLKVAAAFALLDERHAMTEEDYALAGVLMAVSDATRSSVVAYHREQAQKANEAKAYAEAHRQTIVNETVAERALPRVAAKILTRLNGAGPTPWSQARRETHKRDRPLFEEAVEALLRSGQIEIETTPKARILRPKS